MRKLTLRKETLTQLTDAELAEVVGASGALCLTDPCITPPVTGLWCLTRPTYCS